MLPKYPNIGTHPLSAAARVLGAVALACACLVLSCAAARAAEPPPGGVRVPLESAVTAIPPSVLKWSAPGRSCSATVIAREGGRVLILTCAHCPDGAPSATRQPSATFTVLATGATFAGRGVAGRDDADCALYVATAEVEPARVNGTLPRPGASVEHWGITSGHATGRVLALPNLVRPLPTQLFRSTMSSIPGDSGAGVFHEGELVAWNWGYYLEPNKVQAGTPVAFAVQTAIESAEVRRLFPAQTRAWGAAEPPAPPVVEPPVIEPPAPPARVCPPCPIQYDRRGPVRRFLFPRR